MNKRNPNTDPCRTQYFKNELSEHLLTNLEGSVRCECYEYKSKVRNWLIILTCESRLVFLIRCLITAYLNSSGTYPKLCFMSVSKQVRWSSKHDDYLDYLNKSRKLKLRK